MNSPRHREVLMQIGDHCVAEARRFAEKHADARGFLPQAWVYEYWRIVNDASNAYGEAGLGLLARRVAFFARRVAESGDRENVRVAWTTFDKLNATVPALLGGIVTTVVHTEPEGGAA